MEHIEQFRARLAEINNLNNATAVLSWDQSTYMPPGGAAARAEQLATLAVLAHRMFVAPETARLLDAAERSVEANGLPPDGDDACLVRVVRRDYERATRVPESQVEEEMRSGALAYDVWTRARDESNFALFTPWLRTNVELARRRADYLGYERHPYDALLDQYEPGMTVARLRPFFARLREGVAPLLAAIVAHADAVDDAVLYRSYPEETQLRFAEAVIRDFGYDFARGRLDLTVHPYATAFSRDDVRITTRVSRTFFQMCLMGVMHEAGHGMYEQNVAASLERTPLAEGGSLGLHESQSRLWENVVGRSRGFWGHYFPRARQTFPEALGDVEEETLYRALNHVSPSTIRVEADEVTYNLHIMLRFDLENRLLEGDLAVDDAPEAWNAGMRDYLGITPPNDAEGILQDVHWSHVGIGYFPTYTIGNVLSVQFYDAAVEAIPSIPGDIARGEFGALFGWLRENLYRYGRKFLPDEVVTRATGRPLDPEPYLRYLWDKFGAIYGVRDARSPEPA